MNAIRTDLDSMSPSQAAAPAPEQTGASHGHFAEHGLDYGRIALVAIAIALSRFHPLPAVAGFDPVGVATALIGGYPIFREAIHDLLARRMTMELSMSIALIAALSIHQVLTANVIIVFVLAAEIIEEMTIDRGTAPLRI
jgi:cation transport ATPase